jgi:hypothetical protein
LKTNQKYNRWENFSVLIIDIDADVPTPMKHIQNVCNDGGSLVFSPLVAAGDTL